MHFNTDVMVNHSELNLMTVPSLSIQPFIDAIDTPVALLRRYHIIMLNRAAKHWLGMLNYAHSPEMSASVFDYIHPRTRRAALQLYLDMRTHMQDDEDHPIRDRLAVLHPTQGIKWVEVALSAVPFIDSDYCMATFKPTQVYEPQITTEKQAITSFQRSLAPSHIEKSTLLTDIVSSNQTDDDVLGDFLETLYALIPYDSASIALLQDGNLIFVAAQGKTVDLSIETLTMQVKTAVPEPPDETYKTRFGTAHIIHDAPTHPEWIKVENTSHIRGWMGVELRYGDTLLGMLYIDSVQPHYFSETHAHQALALSKQAVTALVYTRLYQQHFFDADERNRLQEILVRNLINSEMLYAVQDLLFSAESLQQSLPEVLQIIASSMEHTRLLLVIFNTGASTLRHQLNLHMPDDDVWSNYCDAIGQPDLAPDEMPKQDISLPANGYLALQNGQQALGAVIDRRGLLLAMRDPDAPSFTETEHELIITIANQISVALKNELLDAQLRQHTQHLEKLVDERTAQLRNEQRHLQAILDSTAEGIFYMEDFKIQYANTAFCRMVGYTTDELQNQPLSIVRVQTESQMLNFEAMFNKPEEITPGRSETRLRHKDGTEFYADIRFSLVGSPGNDSVRMVAVARDISQERELYFQRARFLANAAHELRTPLSSLILRLHLLRKQPEKFETHLASLDSVTAFLRELVEELLTLSRFERGSITVEKSKQTLQQLIHNASDAHAPFAMEREVEVRHTLPNEDITTDVDSKRFVQMMSNLIVNGINYANEGGRVDVTMTTEEDMLGNRNVIIHVTNDGEGIPKTLLPDDIFEPFSRPSEGSRRETGMSLALVREIATLHSGAVHAHNNNDGGATFRVTLPLN